MRCTGGRLTADMNRVLGFSRGVRGTLNGRGARRGRCGLGQSWTTLIRVFERREGGAQFFLLDVAPGALGVLLGTAHAGCQVLHAVHVETATPVTGWVDALPTLELLHASHHLRFEGTSIIFLVRGGLGRWQ